MLRLNALTLLFCLPVIWTASELLGEEPPTELIVRSGGDLRLLPPASGLRVEAALDGGLMQPIDGVLTVPEGAGEHWLTMISRDALGNVSPMRWVLVRLDDQAPSLELELRPEPVVDAAGRQWVPSGVKVVARAEDAVAGVTSLHLEGGGAVVEEAGELAELELTGSGDVEVLSWAIDRVEQRSEDVRRVLSIDATPPSGDILFTGPQAVSSAPGPPTVIAPATRARAELHDGESGVAGWTAFIDGEQVVSTAWDGPWPAGPHRLSARAVDRVGNIGQVGPIELVVDGQAPSVSWQLLNQGFAGSDGVTYYLPPMAVDVTAEDAVAGLDRIEVSSDGQVFEPWSRGRTFSGEKLLVRAVDRVGNEELQEITWRLDLEPPEILLRTADGRLRDPGSTLILARGEEIHVEAVDRLSGLERASYGLDSLPHRPLPKIIEILDRGTFELEILVVDRVGHEHRELWTIEVVRAGKEDA